MVNIWVVLELFEYALMDDRYVFLSFNMNESNLFGKEEV